MSPELIQIFVFMTCTFALGLFMGWAVWRFGSAQEEAIETLKTEVDYWKNSFEQSRLELWNAQEEHAALQDKENADKS